jgi:hypothetical protein
MPEVRAFHSRNEVDRPIDERCYHDRSECAVGRDIPEAERLDGTGAYARCKDCASYGL